MCYVSETRCDLVMIVDRLIYMMPHLSCVIYMFYVYYLYGQYSIMYKLGHVSQLYENTIICSARTPRSRYFKLGLCYFFLYPF